MVLIGTEIQCVPSERRVPQTCITFLIKPQPNKQGSLVPS